MRTLEINGRTFQLIIKRDTVKAVSGYICDEQNIFYWYKRPSRTKVNIWHNWLEWARETEGIKVFEISGANCMQFSIKGLYIDECSRQYNLYITRDNNKAYLVK